jgi:phage tail sheath protein FI
MCVNIRRFFIFLKHSIDKSTQWAVFEPNSEALWRNVAGFCLAHTTILDGDEVGFTL